MASYFKRHHHDYLLNDATIERNERRTLFVVVLTAVMMVVEIIAGYLTSSMALLADGWHMASHAAALSISLVAYRLARSPKLSSHFSFGAGKFIPLGGYTSAIVLALIAALMAIESFQRLLNPKTIRFEEAIVVAIIGLIVNVISALILSGKSFRGTDNSDHLHGHGDHHHGTHDHNIRSAYLHVIADTLTSVLAIGALVIGKYMHAFWLDSLIGIIASIVILKWAYNLCRDTGWELLDGHAKSIDFSQIKADFEDESISVIDLHVWRIAPKALACEITVVSETRRGPDFYRKHLQEKYGLRHVTVEERSSVEEYHEEHA